MDKGAIFSDCRTYRYVLWRKWDSRPCVMWIGLNPSTADETTDDATIRRCVGFSRRWGFGGIYMLNLYAFRATYPKDMVAAADPVGPDNDLYLAEYREQAAFAVAAWGSLESRYRPRVRWQSRIASVLNTVGLVQCLGLTQDRSPRHPSRLAYAVSLVDFCLAASERPVIRETTGEGE